MGEMHLGHMDAGKVALQVVSHVPLDLDAGRGPATNDAVRAPYRS